jgi:hypothetical protein
MSLRREEEKPEGDPELSPPATKKKKEEEKVVKPQFCPSTVGIIPSVCFADRSHDEYYYNLVTFDVPHAETRPKFPNGFNASEQSNNWTVMENVFFHLSFQDMMRAAMTCRFWYHVALSERLIMHHMDHLFPHPELCSKIYSFFRAGLKTKDGLGVAPPCFLSRVLSSRMAYECIVRTLQEDDMQKMTKIIAVTITNEPIAEQVATIKCVRRYNNMCAAEKFYRDRLRCDVINSAVALLPFDWMTIWLHDDLRPYDFLYFITEICQVRPEVIRNQMDGKFSQVKDVCIIDIHKHTTSKRPVFGCDVWEGKLFVVMDLNVSLEKALLNFITVADRFLRVLPRGTKFADKEKEVITAMRVRSLTYEIKKVNTVGQMYFLGSALMLMDNKDVFDQLCGFDVLVVTTQEIKIKTRTLQMTIPWNMFLRDCYMDWKSMSFSRLITAEEDVKIH